MKICTVCNINKELSEFYFRKKRNIYESECKECRKAKSRLYGINNKDKISKAKKEYREKNRDIVLLKKREWYQKNKEILSKKYKEYYNANPDYKKNRSKIFRENNPDYNKKWSRENKDRHYNLSKKWKENNKDRYLENKRIYEKKKKTSSLKYRLEIILRKRLNNAISGFTKSASSSKLLGCTIEEFKSHLESQFTSEMSWDNYGSYWHIDHILPCAAFDLRHSEEQELCFAWWNMRPLEAKENLVKGSSII